MFFSYEQKKTYENAKICYICKRILKKNMVKKKICEVGDLCHYTSEYRGAAHNICNLKYSMHR